MAKEAKLAVKKRAERGTRACGRLRRNGELPGNVYGHNQPTEQVVVSLSLLESLVRSGVRVFDLDVEGKLDKAILKEVHWDHLGDHLMHFDLLRVDPNERVSVHVPIVLKGTAPGAAKGVLEQPVHTLTINCLTYQIPESITVRIGSLEVGQSIHLRDIELPEGAKVDLPPEAVIVHVIQVQAKDAEAAAAAEPEVVGKKPAADGDKDAKAKDAAGGKKK